MSYKQVHNKVDDNRLYDGAMLIEDVTSVDLPEITYKSDKISVPGTAGDFSLSNPSKLEEMNFTINHNNGQNCEQLAEPRRHNFEFRIARQVLTTATGEADDELVKYRIAATPMQVSKGTVEIGNPLGSSVKYSVLRLEEEIAGRVTTMIDILSGDVRINGVDCSSRIKALLD